MKVKSTFNALLLTAAAICGARANSDWYAAGLTRAQEMEAFGFTTTYDKMVPMLKCADVRCAGRRISEVVRLGDAPEDDEFGSLELPKMIFNQKWFVDRRISVLKYYDKSEELNNLNQFNLELASINTTSTNVTFDNNFDYISVDRDSLNESLYYLNSEVIG